MHSKIRKKLRNLSTLKRKLSCEMKTILVLQSDPTFSCTRARGYWYWYVTGVIFLKTRKHTKFRTFLEPKNILIVLWYIKTGGSIAVWQVYCNILVKTQHSTHCQIFSSATHKMYRLSSNSEPRAILGNITDYHQIVNPEVYWITLSIIIK